MCDFYCHFGYSLSPAFVCLFRSKFCHSPLFYVLQAQEAVEAIAAECVAGHNRWGSADAAATAN